MTFGPLRLCPTSSSFNSGHSLNIWNLQVEKKDVIYKSVTILTFVIFLMTSFEEVPLMPWDFICTNFEGKRNKLVNFKFTHEKYIVFNPVIWSYTFLLNLFFQFLALLSLLNVSQEKTVNIRCFWCLSNQKLPEQIMEKYVSWSFFDSEWDLSLIDALSDYFWWDQPIFGQWLTSIW